MKSLTVGPNLFSTGCILPSHLSLTFFSLRFVCFRDLSGARLPFVAPLIKSWRPRPSQSLPDPDEPIRRFYKHPTAASVGSLLFIEQRRLLFARCHLSFFQLTFIAQPVHITANNWCYSGRATRVSFPWLTAPLPMHGLVSETTTDAQEGGALFEVNVCTRLQNIFF